MKFDNLAKYSWAVLVYNVFVILWGAYVRATGSGAGCGSHWPLCNGVIIPKEPRIETIIEFSHRLTSGFALILVVILLVWAYKKYPRTHRVRLGATLSLFFIITEALVGAGLVLFEFVAEDASVGRAISIGIHLVNTFLLLAALSLTAWWASGGKEVQLSGRRMLLLGFGVAFLGVLFIGVSGAITALGDTLFPAESLRIGIEQDFSPTSHFLVRLRVWHPVIAIVISFYVIFLSLLVGLMYQDRLSRRISLTIIILFLFQLLVGVINLALLAPVWMQIIHLLIADLVWVTLVIYAATVFAIEAQLENDA